MTATSTAIRCCSTASERPRTEP
ncbi:hypothetical protein R2601_04518 [Salipiger bermudensis HTCC2601]|uniref:Uncharacterized protein n=1 Tax=Salipiger bermudensis (strain DSM 26914 / JCM 13377 / KCTC 12554 / HTCC2601) TaxID=314265 RepID=Q0FVU2_SALBH|nr:hypothetical protein R2601_04518 [Salipiger bermudensis HTCC2601]